MAHNLIQVGNSKAIIIPSKIIKDRGYSLSTEFDIIETPDGLELRHKPLAYGQLEFPKLTKPAISSRIKALSGVVHLAQEEIDQDERLQYILSR